MRTELSVYTGKEPLAPSRIPLTAPGDSFASDVSKMAGFPNYLKFSSEVIFDLASSKCSVIFFNFFFMCISLSNFLCHSTP